MELKHMENGSHYETVGKIWDSDAKIKIFTEGEKEASLDTIIPHVERILAIIPKREETAELLKSLGIIDRAEEWIAECEPAEDYSDEHERFVIENGVIVELPITVEQFAAGLSAESLGVTIEDSTENFSAKLYLRCTPDYFAGHSIAVTIDRDGEVRCFGSFG